MRRSLLIVLVVIGVAMAAPQRVALVTDATGTAEQVSANQAARPLRTTMALLPEETLKLARGARVRLIFFADGHRESAVGPCTLRVTPGGAVLVAGPPSSLEVEPAPGQVKLISRGESLEQVGGAAARKDKLRLTMKHALSAPPRFTWEGDPGPAVVQVYHSENLADPVWTSPRGVSPIDYAGPALQPEVQYLWEVHLGVPDPSSPSSTFLILSEASQKEVAAAEEEARRLTARDPRDPTPDVLLMSVYADHYMLEESIQAGQRALKLRPEDAGLHGALGRLLYESGDEAGGQEHEAEAKRLESR